MDRNGDVLRSVQAPAEVVSGLDGAAFDPVAGRALFINQRCRIVEADPLTMGALAVHDLDTTSLHIGTCAGLALGREGNVETFIVASWSTNEIAVIRRDDETLVRKIALGPLDMSSVDGVATLPGSDRILVISSGSPIKMLLTATGEVVSAASGYGESPLIGSPYGLDGDGVLGICANGHVWVCEEYGNKCHDFAPVDGERNVCDCAASGSDT